MAQIADVSTPISAYNSMLPDWSKVDTLMGGTRTMRAAGQTYLPKFASESDGTYQNRLNRSVLTNFFKKTLFTLAGKPFSKPLILDEDMPDDIRTWCEDADLMGNHITVFARDVFKSGLLYGITHILVDYRTRPQGRVINLEEERQLGLRPYLVHIEAPRVIGWRSETRGSREVLTQVRFMENTVVPDGEFGEKTVERVRVLYPGSYQVWENTTPGRITGRAEWKVIEEGATTLPFIPWVTFYADRTGYMTARPPLLDLADKNIEHWQSSSDQRNCLSVARFPILAAAGWNEEDGEIEIGPNRLIKMSDPGAKYYYVEHSGAALSAGRQDMEDLKAEMEAIGTSLLTPRSGNQTATAKSIEYAQETSDLQNMAIDLGDALKTALGYMQAWVTNGRDTEGGSVIVNSDFGIVGAGAEQLNALLALRTPGPDGKPWISRKTLWNELKAAQVLSDDFDGEEEEALLESEGVRMGAMNSGEVK